MLDTSVLIAFVDDKPEPPKGQEKEPPGFLGLPWYTPLVMVLIMFYFMVLVPGRKDRQRRLELLNGLKKNDEVVTSAGIIGVVTSVSDKGDEVTIRSDESRIKVLKSTIVRIVNAKEEAPKEQVKEQPKA